MDARNRGLGIHRIYVDIIASSQAQIGEMWHEGTITISVEHLGTVISLGVMDELSRDAKKRISNGFKAVVALIEGDTHFIGARMLSDFLMMDGWTVDFLGGPTPIDDLVDFVDRRSFDLVALSSTLFDLLPKAKLTAKNLSSLTPRPKILLGGFAVANSDINDFDDCDAIARDAIEGLTEARRIVGLTEQKLTLEDHLFSIGKKIRSIRNDKHITQQDLADSSGLDRTYISAVEQGKQNLTLGAVFRLADALDLTIGELVSSPDM